MVAKRKLLLPVPHRHKLVLLVEAQLVQHLERFSLQLGGFRSVRHVGGFLLEKIVLARGELGELRKLLVRLAVLRREHLRPDVGSLLLLQVPEQVPWPVLARQALDVRHRLDVGELACLLALQRREKLRQRGFVVLPRQFHRLLLGAETLELLGGFVLTAEKIALARSSRSARRSCVARGRLAKSSLSSLVQDRGGSMGGASPLSRDCAGSAFSVFSPGSCVAGAASSVESADESVLSAGAADAARSEPVAFVSSFFGWRSLRSTAAASCVERWAGVFAGAVSSSAFAAGGSNAAVSVFKSMLSSVVTGSVSLMLRSGPTAPRLEA